jgi:hypothetical protein
MTLRILIMIAGLVFAPLVASAQIVETKGMSTVRYAGKSATPAERAQAQRDAKVNAVERFIADTNPAKQRLFDAARDRLAASIDTLILSATPISETDDPKSKTYTLVLRAEINSARLDNALADSSRASPARAAAAPVVVVFLSRTPASIKTFDDRVLKRSETTNRTKDASEYREKTSEGEKISASSVSTSGSRDVQAASSSTTMSETTTGGSTVRKADVVEWVVSSSEDVDQQMTGVFAAAGMEVVPSEFVIGLDLAAARKDFGGGDDLDPATLRAMVAAVRGAQVSYLILGTMDQGLRDTDPVSGATRVYVKVKARVYDLTKPYPRVLSAIEPTEFAGLGPTTAVANTNALKLAASQVAEKLVDEITVKGVR